MFTNPCLFTRGYECHILIFFHLLKIFFTVVTPLNSLYGKYIVSCFIDINLEMKPSGMPVRHECSPDQVMGSNLRAVLAQLVERKALNIHDESYHGPH